MYKKLQLPPLGKLTALKSAKLYGKTIQLGCGGLPASLTSLQLSGTRGDMPQVRCHTRAVLAEL